ncbi:TetR/AcrR family transcriptional regulator [Paenibacillus hamazuiensis]|uniref:TetR/AcrR family transcriptional regulator n=1 Tax=Paenibacillus hamazuiensis TaxID=2936508 RepID=UPI00200C7388
MPRNKEQNEEIRRQRKEAIIRGALKVYVEKGYAAAEIGDVAERAGVARGLVYYYFKDKRELFRELFTHMFEMSKRHVQSHFAGDGPVLPMLEKFIITMCSNMLEESDHVLFFMRMRHDLHELFSTEELANWNWHHENMAIIRQTLERGMQLGEIRNMSPELLALQFWGALMHSTMFFRHRNKELLEKNRIKADIEQSVDQDIRDAVVGCLALVASPSNES